MIEIDGQIIKKLRESQGLTQLYIATVVEVTTDTISRWENKRYPTIKRENALKLAEALEVELDDILLKKKERTETIDDHSHKQPLEKKSYPFKFYAIAAIAFLIVSVTIAGIIHYRKAQPVIQAQRIMPSNTITGLPFPIVIKVHSSQPGPISLIIKEFFPENCEILVVSPLVPSSAAKGQIKWIQKMNSTSRFSYLVKIAGETGKKVIFSGSIASSQGNDTPIKISGSNTVQLGTFHWADSDGNNKIDDQEILNIFDRYSDIDDFKIDIDLIERMWLGSSYSWDGDKKQISITP
jgi:transcriptional regulator with XRE-family HTH domain